MATSTKTPQTIIEKVKAALKLGPDGKVMSFFERETKKLDRNIKNLTSNRAALISTYESDLEVLEDQITDAEDAVEAAYVNITPEDVANNAAQDSFSDTYWSNITRAENKVKSLKEDITCLTEAHEAKLKVNQEQIDRYTARRTAIQG